MPKTPVTSRTLFWETLSDGSLVLLDWHQVSTSLGLMIEPRTILRPMGEYRDEDLFDSSFSDLQRTPAIPTGNYALDQAIHSGRLWPHQRADDPGVE